MVTDSNNDSLRIGNLRVDLKRESLHDAEGKPVALRAQSFEVLRYLAQNPNRVVTKDELATAVWQGVTASDDSLVQCISDIRRLVGDDAHRLIKTVQRRGYRLTLAPDHEAGARPDRRRLFAVAASAAAIVAALVIWIAASLPEQAQSLPVIAVQPFESGSSDEVSSRLASGLTDEVSVELARMPELAVSRGSGQKEPSVDFARSAGADYVLEGTVRREADRIRISASLIDSTTGNQQWSDLWDRPAEDLLETQSEIAGILANKLGGGEGIIQQLGRAKARTKPTQSLDAYELYLVATEKLIRMSPESVAEAYTLLHRAIERNPEFARAWVELYHTADILAQIGDPGESQKFRNEARQVANRAVELDPGDAEAYAVLAISLTKDGEIERAHKAFNTALNIAPNAFEIMTFYAAYAAAFGEVERGAEMAERAIRVNPDYPFWATGPFAYAFFEGRRPKDALREIRRRPKSSMKPGLWVIKADALHALGKRDEAKRAVQEALSHYPALSVEWILDLDPSLAPPTSRFVEAMLAVGFPLCAPDRELPTTARLLECSDDQLTSARSATDN